MRGGARPGCEEARTRGLRDKQARLKALPARAEYNLPDTAEYAVLLRSGDGALATCTCSLRWSCCDHM